jgi:hypothetical protein
MPPLGARFARWPALAISLLVLAGSGVSAVRAQGCPGCAPLDDLAGSPYLGRPMGLYPGVTNSPPPVHLALALSAAAGVMPRDDGGFLDPDGWIGLLSIGMSNANQEFAVFERADDASASRNARVVIVDGAVGSQTAEEIADPSAPYWTTVDDRVAAAGLDPDQIQVLWLKEADGAVPDTSFPAHADTLQAHLRAIVVHLKDRFPRLALCYLSSRIYGGYTARPDRGEPLSYETAFAIRGLIEDQIGGDPGLNADPNAGPVEAPVLLWGPYLWANGVIPRASDGLTWLAGDYEPDNVHPSPSGEVKVALLLGSFFSSDPTATVWHADDSGEGLQVVTAEADAYVDGALPSTNFGAAAALAWRWQSIRSYVRFDLSGATDPPLRAKLSLMCLPDDAILETEIVVVTDNGWEELTITAANAPAFDGAVLGAIPAASRGTAVSLDVTDAVAAAIAGSPGAAELTLGIRAAGVSAAVHRAGSRESIDPPRLVLTMPPGVVHAAGAPRLDPRLDVAPNPLARAATVTLTLEHDAASLAIDVFDVRGRRVRRLADGPVGAGPHGWSWNGRDDAGRPLPAGVYFVRAAAGAPGSPDVRLARKISLVR